MFKSLNFGNPMAACASRRDVLKATAGLGLMSLAGASWLPKAARAYSKRAALDSVLTQTVARDAAPFVVAMLGTSEGITYSGAAGERAPGIAAGDDMLFRLFSMTKPIGQVCAMILYERGLLDFDMPVEDILPEFAAVQFLVGIDGDAPITRAPANKATVRHLATHTSGLVYDSWSHEMAAYAAATNYPGILVGTREYLDAPMVFEPGARWHYGISTDWLGLVIEKISGQPINTFVQNEIFDPLGMTGAMFDLKPGAKDLMSPAVLYRDPAKGFTPFPVELPVEPEFYGMGQAIQATAPDYMKFLRMLLNGGMLDGNRILSSENVDLMFQNAIGDLTVHPLATTTPFAADMNFFPDTTKTHSLFGMRIEEDVPGRRRAGSQIWAGFANTHFWIDPVSDVAAVFMTQTAPFAEEPFLDAFGQFETTVYTG